MKRKIDVIEILTFTLAGLTVECFWIWLCFASHALIVFPIWFLVIVGVVLGATPGSAGLLFKKRHPVSFDLDGLPVCAADYIKLVIKHMRYRRYARQEVACELTDHFEDALKGCSCDEAKEKKARELIEEFGNAKLLAVLMRRAKKRCRPLWRTAALRSFQTAAVLIICLILYIAWFITGKPVLKVDYLAVLNQINRPQQADTDNAWPLYEKTVNLFIEPNEQLKKTNVFSAFRKSYYTNFVNIDHTRQELIRQWIAQNENAWQLYLKASQKPFYFKAFSYNARDKERWLYNILLPELTAMIDLHYLGLWRARIWADEGKIENGLYDSLAVAKTGRHWQTQPTSTTFFLVGVDMTKNACRNIIGLLAMYDVNKPDLVRLYAEVNELFPQDCPMHEIEEYKISFLDLVQHLFTEGGPGGGHLIPAKINQVPYLFGGVAADKHSYEFLKEYVPKYEKALETAALASMAMEHAGRDETLAKAQIVFNRAAEISRLTPYQRKHAGLTDKTAVFADLPLRRFRLIYAFEPDKWITRTSEARFKFKATYEALKTILAVLQWQTDKGSLPQRLEELVESGYLNSLPADPYSDSTLIYKKTDDGFTLYSVGLNFTDDHGKAAPAQQGKLKMWDEQGDEIFWPVSCDGAER